MTVVQSQSCFALYNHIKSSCSIFAWVILVEMGIYLTSARPILRSAAKSSASGSGLAFRGWIYAITAITFDPTIELATNDPNILVCLDTGYGVILIDKVWLVKKVSSQEISAISVSLKVRGISASQYKSGEFALAAIYISDLDQNHSKVYVCIICDLYLVEGLKANMLIDSNVFCTKSFLINLANAFAHILSYKVNIITSTRYHFEFLKQRVLVHAMTFIPPKSEVLVPF